MFENGSPRTAQFLRAVGKLLVPLVALCVGLVSVAVARADSGDLAVAFQVDVAHSGVQTDAALAPPFERRWRVSLPGQVSYPLIAQGKIFVTTGGSNTGSPALYALDQASGQVVWSHLLPSYLPWANAAYDAGRIFVVSNNVSCCSSGVLRAYDADTGDLVWTAQLPGQYSFTSPPTAANGVVYIGGSGLGGTLYAVRETDGQLLATQPVKNGDNSAPALSGSRVFVSYACNQTYEFAQGTLAPLWHYSGPCEGGGGKTPVYADGRLYTRDFNGDLILDAGTGALVRDYGPTNGGGYAPAVDSTAIVTTFPGWMVSAQSLSGTPLWVFLGDGLLNTPPLILNSGSRRLLILGSWSGRLYALDATTGAEVWSSDVGVPISGAPESGVDGPQAGLGIGQGLLVVPAGSTLSAYGTDETAPTINAPATISAVATSTAGAVVSYSVTATDPDGTATVTCTPPSGSSFPIGTTTVHCTATDAAGNSTTASFLVVVSAPNADCNLSHYPISKGILTLKNANLAGCYLPGANLAGANATNANFTGAYLAGANLSAANLSQAQMQRSVLSNANLSAAKLNLAVLTGANLTGATLTGVTWAQTTCPDGTNSNNNGYTCTGHLG
jgi:outer membrane protein assembly factor BamB